MKVTHTQGLENNLHVMCNTEIKLEGKDRGVRSRSLEQMQTRDGTSVCNFTTV